jgi:ribonuclease R
LPKNNSTLPSEEQVLDVLIASPKPLHAGAIAKELEISRAHYREFAEWLEAIASAGIILRSSGNRYRSPRARPEAEQWEGIISVNPRGFGFVNASGRPDVYVPPEAIAEAWNGDTVMVEATARTARGVEGRVVQVLVRRNLRVAGTVHKKRKSAWLEPDDTRIRGPIVLNDAQAIDEEGRMANDGDAAVVEITRFPESLTENAEGILKRVLGRPGEAEVEVAKIKVREQIEEEHPPAAVAEAEKWAVQGRKLSPEGRTDLRHVHFLTIDPKDARDHDDSVYAERTADGFRVYIAIADVSYYVRENTALDAEALRRGCTIYLPDRAIPMLPGSLAADLCSLLPEQERYCLCVIAELDDNAVVRECKIVEGLMRAAALITYDSAARSLGFTEEPPLSPQAEAFKRELKVLAQIAAKLRHARLKRGALDLDLPEAQVILDDEGSPIDVRRRARDPGIKKAYQIVEELMLLANEQVASWLIRRSSPAIFRVHGKPDEEKLQRLATMADVLGAPFDLDEVMEPKGLSEWLKQISRHPKRAVLEGLLLRSLKQASYDVNNQGHFGLASEAYVHFTSPIRRYPDLLVHRTVRRLLQGRYPEDSPLALTNLRRAATQSSARERATMSVEREVVDLYRALHARSLLGEIYEGRVTALVGGGVFVGLDQPFLDVMISYEGMGPDRYVLSDDELSFVGTRSGERISLGDVLSVEIEEASILRRTVYGRRIAHSASAAFASDERRKSKRGESNRGRQREAESTTKPRSAPARGSRPGASKKVTRAGRPAPVLLERKPKRGKAKTSKSAKSRKRR